MLFECMCVRVRVAACWLYGDGGHLHINESCRSHAADPIYSGGRTGRPGKRQRTAELLQITTFPSPHRPCQTSAHRHHVFSSFLPCSFFLLLFPPEGISVIGNGEFKRAVIACARHPDSNPPD